MQKNGASNDLWVYQQVITHLGYTVKSSEYLSNSSAKTSIILSEKGMKTNNDNYNIPTSSTAGHEKPIPFEREEKPYPSKASR